MAISLNFILSSFSVSALVINEIMYNPSQDDNYNEWIEIFNDGSDINLKNFSLCGKILFAGYIDREGNMHRNTSMILEANNYAVISDGGSGTEVYDNFDIDDDALALHVDASTLCGGLSNSGKTIKLENNGNIIDEVTYEDDAEEGYSLELINGNFIQSQDLGGTPGTENEATSEVIGNNGNNEQINNTDNQEKQANQNSDDNEEDNEDAASINNSAEYKKELNVVSDSAVKKEKIMLNSPVEKSEEKDEENNTNNFISNQEKLRFFVIGGFFIFSILLIILLALKRL